MRVNVLYVSRRGEETQGFWESWQRFGPGMDCGINVVVKECWESRPLGWLRRLADRTEGFVCLLNASSRIHEEGWLLKLYEEASRPSCGFAGCSASWESFASNRPAWWRRKLHWDFPNAHIRTNAFVIRADMVRKFLPRTVWCKAQEHLLESGRWGLTRRCIEAGFEPVIVTRSGEVLPRDQWNASGFRSGTDLLVSDRRCDEFRSAAPLIQEELRGKAWGI